MKVGIRTTAFASNGMIPTQFTCDGVDVSPRLSWDPLPPGTKSIALVCDDPDAPRGTWTHWLLYDLPPSTLELPEGVPAEGELATGGRQGTNDSGRIGYSGPCPPPGAAHRYFFRIYALDAVLGVKAGAHKDDVRKAIAGHILAEGEMIGRYARAGR